MKIAGVQYDMDSKSLDVFISGCLGNCKGCHNSKIKDFNVGVDYIKSKASQSIEDVVNSYNNIKGGLHIDRIRIMGGEPLDNTHSDVLFLISQLKTNNLPIVLFTRRELEDVPEVFKATCDYLKCGAYDCSVTTYKEQYGMSVLENQNYYKKGIDY